MRIILTCMLFIMLTACTPIITGKVVQSGQWIGSTNSVGCAQEQTLGNGKDGSFSPSLTTNINTYATPSLDIVVGSTLIKTRDDFLLVPGDIILILNMFTGVYELVNITSVSISSRPSETSITIQQPVKVAYPAIQTQFIRVPQYTTVSIPQGVSITALPFDGRKGGVIALLATTSITVQGSIDASFKGFSGGSGSGQCDGHCPRVNNGLTGQGPGGGSGSSCTGSLSGQGGTLRGGQNKLMIGSGGGGGQCTSQGGTGGGGVFLATQTLSVQGNIRVDGSNGASGTWQRSGSVGAYPGGGGAGGTIYLAAKTFSIDSGQLLARSGTGGYDVFNQQFAPSGELGVVQLEQIGISCSPECLQGKIPDDNPTLGCCGNTNQCMSFTNATLCTQTSNNTWQWLTQNLRAKTFTSVCGNQTSILVAEDYYSCGTQLSQGTIALTITNTSKHNQSHDYACYDKETQLTIAECRGQEPALSNSEHNTVGARITNIRGFGSQTFYCTNSQHWTTDLDNADKETCTAAGYVWTGSTCCTDEINETYNEPNTLPTTIPSWKNQTFTTSIGNTSTIIGGCWQSQYIPLGQYARTENNIIPTIINYQGRFYNCNNENITILNLKDTHTKEQVFQTTTQQCAALQNARPGTLQPHAVCTSQGWIFDQELRNTSSSIAWQVPEIVPFGFSVSNCCASTSCWNGTNCIQDQSTQASTTNTYPGNKRCIKGQWTVQAPKITFDGNGKGFCPQQSQCLFDPLGNPLHNGNIQQITNTRSQDRPQCLNESQYVSDNLCNNGDWTSRTRKVSTNLLSHALQTTPLSYTIYCDSLVKAIPWIEELDEASTISKACTDTNMCTNNLCILKTPTSIAFGTALNTQEPIGLQTFFSSLGLSGNLCSSIDPKEASFVSCSEGIWYNPKLNAIIYLPQGILQPFDKNSESIINQSLQSIIANAQLHTTTLRQFNQLYPTTRMLSSVYINRKESAFLFSFVERMQRRPAGTGMFQDWLGMFATSINHQACLEQPPGSIRQYDSQATCTYDPQTQTTILLRSHQAQPLDTSPSPLIINFENIAGKLRP